MVVDTHAHIYPPEIADNWERIAETERYFSVLARGRAHRWGTADDLLRSMAQDGIDQSWVCGFAFSDLELCRLCNDYVLESAAASAGRLRPMCVVPPLARGAEAEIARCFERGAVGVGELFPDGQCWTIDEIRETWRVVGAAQERGMFVLIHAAEPVGRAYPGKGERGPKEAYALACNHPEAHFVLAHWGGGLFLYETMPEVRDALRNVWYDTASAPFVYAPPLCAAAAAIVPDKLLYGSDFPLLRYPRYETMFGQAGVSSEQAAGILSENAATLLFRLRF